MISGLVPEKALDKIFSVRFWSNECEEIKVVIEKMYTKMRKVYWTFINSVYSYKDLHKFQN